jgi:hypothetical protein
MFMGEGIKYHGAWAKGIKNPRIPGKERNP